MTTRRPPTLPENPWADLTGTQRRIVLELLRHGRLSRPQIMEGVGISPASITRLTAPLVASGLLTATAEQVAATGRPQTPLEVRAEAESIVGATLSVTSLTVVVTDLTLTPHASVQVPLGSRSPADVVALLKDTVAEAVSGAGRLPPPACAGISLGGATRGGRVVGEATFYGWSSVPLARLAEEALGVPCTVANDLVALTLGEAWFGAGRSHRRFDVVTVGSGVGLGLACDGNVVTTPSAELGLMGTVPVPDGARPATARAAMDTLTDSALERVWRTECGRSPLRAAQVVRLAVQGDADAVATVSSFARRLGRLIAMAAAFTLPEVVVVAGERADVAALFEDQVMVGISSLRRSSAGDVRLEVREHHRADWARGAATLALRHRVMADGPAT